MSILLHNGAVFSANGWLTPGYVLINGDTITAVGAGNPPVEVAAKTVIDAHHHAVLPGFINGHTHLSQTFMRGLGGGRPLLTWLKERIWPLQSAMTPEILRLAALLGLVENLRSGVTSVVNHHKVTTTAAHTDAVCSAAETVGIRLVLARSWADRGTNAEAPERILSDLSRLFEQWAASPLISAANGPLVPWRCSGDTLQRTHTLAQQYNAPTHIHVGETRDEVQMTLNDSGQRPVAWLDSLGVLGPNTQIVHSVWVDEHEIALMAERGSMLVHCPVSNAVLGSGIAPLTALHRAGIRLRLGTDGPASNDQQDMFEAMKQALCFARAAALDPTVVAPADVLQMALDGRTLIPGAPADVITVNLNHARAVPIHDLTSALVLCTPGTEVDTVIVGGKRLMQDKKVLVLDENGLFDDCRTAAHELRARAGMTLSDPQEFSL